jgi:hypothetical protein
MKKDGRWGGRDQIFEELDRKMRTENITDEEMRE